MRYFFISSLVLIACLSTFNLALAQSSSLIPCNIDNAFTECTFSRIFGINNGNQPSLFGKVYNFMVFTLAVPLATLSIMVGGVMYATSSLDSGKRATAKKIIYAAVIGLVLTLGSYLIVKTIVNALTSNNSVGSTLKLK